MITPILRNHQGKSWWDALKFLTCKIWKMFCTCWKHIENNRIPCYVNQDNVLEFSQGKLIYFGKLFLVGGLEHFLLSISYMGCHPSHWLSYVSRWLKPPTRSLLLLFLRSHYNTMCFPISYEFSTGVSKNSVYGHRRHILLRPDHTRTFNTNNNWLVVWNMLYFSIQLGMPSSQLTFIFFRGVETTNQIRMMIITIKT